MTGPTVALYVDGQQLIDGSTPAPDDAPTALDGLTVTWGRTSTVDQPGPSVCTFDVLDQAGGATFLGRLYTGAQITVRAAATVDAPATLPVNTDPGFEQTPPGSLPASWNPVSYAAVSTDRAATGVQSVKVARDGYSDIYAALEVAPGPRGTGNPAAWDDIPTMHPGEHWAVTVTVWATTATRVDVAPRHYSAPDRPEGTVGRTTFTAAPGQWTTMLVDVVVPANLDGRWLGVDVFVYWPTWATSSGTWADAAGSWLDAGIVYVDDLELLAPVTADLVLRDVVVFDGRITDLDARWDDPAGGLLVSVAAADFTADLANRDVGAVPWPAEPVRARIDHILAGGGLTIPYLLAPTLAAAVLSWMDVDRQQVLPLLQDVATSVDGVLWSAVHADTGPYLALADPAAAAALYRLAPGEGGLYTIVPTQAADNAIELDAVDVLRDPVTFHQSTSDIVTRAAVSWQEQTTDDQGVPAPTEHTETVIDTALEIRLGTRRIGVTTILTSAADAVDVADRILARLRAQSWRAAGLTWDVARSDLDSDRTGRALDLLDGTRRLAAPLLVSNLPAWAPVQGTLPLFLQGGTYTYTAGAWVLDLTAASAQSQGVSLAWQDVDPSISWADIDPAVTWLDLIGVTT